MNEDDLKKPDPIPSPAEFPPNRYDNDPAFRERRKASGEASAPVESGPVGEPKDDKGVDQRDRIIALLERTVEQQQETIEAIREIDTTSRMM